MIRLFKIVFFVQVPDGKEVEVSVMHEINANHVYTQKARRLRTRCLTCPCCCCCCCCCCLSTSFMFSSIYSFLIFCYSSPFLSLSAPVPPSVLLSSVMMRDEVFKRPLLLVFFSDYYSALSHTLCCPTLIIAVGRPVSLVFSPSLS